MTTEDRSPISKDAFRRWCDDATETEIELYIANPARGVELFTGYNHYHNTAQERELLALARLEVNRRVERRERRKWRVTTLVAIAAPMSSFASCAERWLHAPNGPP